MASPVRGVTTLEPMSSSCLLPGCLHPFSGLSSLLWLSLLPLPRSLSFPPTPTNSSPFESPPSPMTAFPNIRTDTEGKGDVLKCSQRRGTAELSGRRDRKVAVKEWLDLGMTFSKHLGLLTALPLKAQRDSFFRPLEKKWPSASPADAWGLGPSCPGILGRLSRGPQSSETDTALSP